MFFYLFVCLQSCMYVLIYLSTSLSFSYTFLTVTTKYNEQSWKLPIIYFFLKLLHETHTQKKKPTKFQWFAEAEYIFLYLFFFFNKP